MRRTNMSWFKHRPKVREPSRRTPHNSSPMSEKLFKETKEQQKEQHTPVDSKSK